MTGYIVFFYYSFVNHRENTLLHSSRKNKINEANLNGHI